MIVYNREKSVKIHPFFLYKHQLVTMRIDPIAINKGRFFFVGTKILNAKKKTSH